MSGNKKPDYSQLKQLGALTTIPILLLVGPGVGYLVGSWLDNQWQWSPWGAFSLSGLGFVAAGRQVILLLKEVLKNEK